MDVVRVLVTYPTLTTLKGIFPGARCEVGAGAPQVVVVSGPQGKPSPRGI